MNGFDIQVMKLDDAYTDSNGISVNISKSQRKFLEDLESIINNLKEHWHGDDATNFINSLIDEYDKYVEFFGRLGMVANYLPNYFVLLQITRAKLCEVKRVGQADNDRFEPKEISKIEPTNTYYYDERLKTDYDNLNNLIEFYSKFVNSVDADIEKLLKNWRAGTGREEVKSYFDAFDVASKKISTKLVELKDKIGLIISNEGQLL